MLKRLLPYGGIFLLCAGVALLALGALHGGTDSNALLGTAAGLVTGGLLAHILLNRKRS